MFESPHPAQPNPFSDNYIQPNLGYGLRIWWAFYWRTLLSTYATLVVFNLGLRGLWQAGVLPDIFLRPASFIIRYDVYPINYLFAFAFLGLILRKRFRGFRVALLSSYGGEGAHILRPTFARTARVWWTFFWRSIVYRIIITVATMFPLGWIISFLVALVPAPAFATAANVTMQVLLDGVVGIVVIYSAILDEDIADFRVALIPLTADSTALATPPVAEAENS